MAKLSDFLERYRNRPGEEERQKLPREEVALAIAELVGERSDMVVMGPMPQTGPMGGELETMTIVVQRNGVIRYVTVNVYGRAAWPEEEKKQ